MDYTTSVAYNYNETTKQYTKCYPLTHMNAVYTKDDESETLGNKLADIDNAIDDNVNKIGVLTTQMSEKTNLKDEQLLKGILYSASAKDGTLNIETDITYYQAVVKNPLLDTEYTNIPIELKVNFNKGEVPSIDYLVVKKSDGTKVAFQWEGATHPNYLMTENLATYNDGSLKSGSIWIMDTLESNSANIYTIEVHSTIQGNSFADNIVCVQDVSNPVAPKDTFTIGNAFLMFDYATGGYQLKKYTINNVEFNYTGELLFCPFIKDTAQNTIQVLNNASTNWNLSKSLTGEGYVYKDYVITATKISNTNIKITTKYRLFANGLISIDCRFLALDNLTTREVQGFGSASKSLGGTNRNFSYDLNDACYNSVLNDNSASISYQILNTSLAEDITNPTISYNSKCIFLAGINGEYEGINVLWENDGDRTIPKNSLFLIKANLAPFNNYNILMNMLSVHATKHNEYTLKQRYLSLCKMFADHMHNYGFGSTFPGLVSYEKMAYDRLNNIIKSNINNNDITNYILALNNKYGNCTLTTSWRNKWEGRIYGYGTQFIGRDTAPIMYFRKLAMEINDTNSSNTLTLAIHALADFYVWAENYAGNDGSMLLQNGNEDNLNSEATAMKALHNSLSIESNSTRQACYDRIKTKFESQFKYRNILPYNSSSSLWRASQSHYHAYSLFEYLGGVDKNNINFDLGNYINQYTTTTGKLVELGYEYSASRIGFLHSSIYSAYIMYIYGNISSLETACKLMENVLSKCYPSGGHQFPLDGWKNVNGSTIDQIIETQASYEALMEIIFAS